MNPKEWLIPYDKKPSAPQELLDAGCTPLLAALLASRGKTTVGEADCFLHTDHAVLHDPFLLTDMHAAVDRIGRAMESGEKVAVFGDYDVDGITATCLLTDYLRTKGLNCIPYIPDRVEEGYGLNTGAVDKLHEAGVSLIVTVDCGITALEEVRYAASLGVDVVVTDHHECGPELPSASAVVNCKRDEAYPILCLAGVGVALKLACACEGSDREIVERYCDLVAIGTVADVMPLEDENRYLVRRGLEKINSAPRPGIRALLQDPRLKDRQVTASTIGFSLAPRLNAAGRIGDPGIALGLLMSPDLEGAEGFARELEELNDRRREIADQIEREAEIQLGGVQPDAPIVLAGEDDWNPGVIGIVASRLSEKYALPAVVIRFSDNVGKGSCRGCPGFNLYEAFSACSEHLISFGGHSSAAGLNIRREKLDDFRASLAVYYRENHPERLPEVCPELLIRDPALLSIENVRSLDLLEPFGSCNPKPSLCLSDVPLRGFNNVGRDHEHLHISVQLGSQVFDGIFFKHTSEELGLRPGKNVDVVFSPQINEYQGHVSVQLLVSELRVHDPGQLCGMILGGRRDVLWACAPYRPSRDDCSSVWLRFLNAGKPLPDDVEGILAMDRLLSLGGEKLCLCLAVFQDLGLISSHDGRILGAAKPDIVEKTELDHSSVMKQLNGC